MKSGAAGVNVIVCDAENPLAVAVTSAVPGVTGAKSCTSATPSAAAATLVSVSCAGVAPLTNEPSVVANDTVRVAAAGFDSARSCTLETPSASTSLADTIRRRAESAVAGSNLTVTVRETSTLVPSFDQAREN